MVLGSVVGRSRPGAGSAGGADDEEHADDYMHEHISGGLVVLGWLAEMVRVLGLMQVCYTASMSESLRKGKKGGGG